ncbi:MAG: ATP-binding protein [Candidatus Omnitrophota bacterium]
MKTNSIRFKISVLYTALLGVILLIFSSILYFSLQWTLYDDLDDELRIKADAISNAITSYIEILGTDRETLLFTVKRIISKEGEYAGYSKIMDLDRQWAQKADKLDIENDYVDFIGPGREILTGSGDLSKEHFSILSRSIKSKKEDAESFVSIKFENRNLRMINKPFVHAGERYVIQVATSLKPVSEILKMRLIFILFSIPPILIFASLIGYFLTTKSLKPVKQVTLAAQSITHKDLSARVESEQADEEMRYLVDTFNSMIERLEKSFKHISEFTSHVAHELKTPLAILRGETELILRKDRSPEEYRQVMQGNLDEIHRMLKIVENLLLLSRIEHQPDMFKFEGIAVRQFLTDIYEEIRILASQKNISVNLTLPEHDSLLNADRLNLRRLFLNLVSNAIKFTPKNGTIKIEASYKGKKTLISIIDTGIGIPEENMEKIFDRFFSYGNAKLNLEQSTGLGLNLALGIAKAHRGDITVKSESGKGSIFTVVLPSA